MSKAIVTVETKKGIVSLNGYASQSARIYVQTLIDACRRLKVDPRAALIDTDDYPRVMRATMIEFAIGWLHGCAEAHELHAEQLFDAIEPRIVTPEKVEHLKASWGIEAPRKPKAREIRNAARNEKRAKRQARRAA